jgi:hypothetical protein
MKYAVEIASDGIIYIPTFINNNSGIQNLLGLDTDTNTQTAR